ncbi:hypothetical protein [Arthrobacter ulcerisalmonis]|nr:hypothetical protein [Arthrobacter ulcerisalmonis]
MAYNSSRILSRTGIHGGLRRGTAAAAIGAVLVLTAGTGTTHADDSVPWPKPGTLEVQAVLPSVAVVESSVDPTPGASTSLEAPSPSPSATAPGTPAPTSPAPTSPAPSSSAAPTAAPTSTAAPVTPVPTVVPPSSAPTTTAPPTSTPPGVVPKAADAGPATEEAPEPVVPEGPATLPAAVESGEPTVAPQETALQRRGTFQIRTSSSVRLIKSGAVDASVAATPGPEMNRFMVWLGLGLVGLSGAAGVTFLRVRRR